jgi:hypothetical protein
MGPRSKAAGDNAATISQQSPPATRGFPKHRRREPRHRTHLRSGYITDVLHRFICDCFIRDYSTKGARLILPRDILAPNRIWFFDDEVKKPVMADVRWRRGQEIGIQKIP